MLNLFFPKTCKGCGGKLLGSEEIICLYCRGKLPLACFHRTESSLMKQFFFGRLPVENATALLQFQKGNITQKLMHELKYRGQEEIGDFLGVWLGTELKEISNFQSISMVIPVPLDSKKYKKRGYNQVARFGKAIANKLVIPYDDETLLKKETAKSQVFKGRIGRFGGKAVFQNVRPEGITGKHILLVDDLITTGATLEKCGVELLKSKDVTLSIATMAIAL